MDSRQSRTRQIKLEISEILFRYWDPIGINDVSTADEYDAYIEPVYRALVAGASEGELIGVLTELENTDIGMRAPWHRKKDAAGRLGKLKIGLPET